MEKIKKILNKDNLIMACVALILALIAMLNFSVAIYANNERTVCLNLKPGDVIKSVVVSSNSLNLDSYSSEKTEIRKINEDEKELIVIDDVNIEINISIIDSLDISFERTKNQDSVIYYTIDGQKFETNNNIGLYPSKTEILKNSINSKSIYIFIISYFVILACLLMINNTLKRVKENNLKIYNIILMLISIFVIYLSSIYLFMMINRILAIIPGILLSLYFLKYFKFSIKEWDNIFLLITSVIGTMMIFIITPGNVPDEPSHYVRSYIDSMLISDEAKDNVKLPADINRFFNKFTHSVHKLDVKYSGISYMTEISRNIDYSNSSDIVTNYQNTRYLSFLPYLLASIINFIGRNLNLPILIVFLVCRLGNFVISTILCYLAIKTTPKFKKIFAMLAIFPVFLQQAAGIDMDYLTNSVAFLFIANIFKYRFGDTELKIKDILLISGIGVALGLCKFGYFPILLLILLIPNSKFYSKKRAIVFKLALLILPIVISCAANFTAVSNPNESTDKYTITSVLSNPINSAKICLKTFFKRFEADTFSGLINGFGWSTKYQLEISLWTFSAVSIIILFSDNEDSKDLRKKDRIIMIVVWAVIYLILYGVAFTEWTSIESGTINGLQARYFVPILPLFYIVISNNFITLENIKDKWKFYTVLLFISEILSNISILIAFY